MKKPCYACEIPDRPGFYDYLVDTGWTSIPDIKYWLDRGFKIHRVDESEAKEGIQVYTNEEKDSGQYDSYTSLS